MGAGKTTVARELVASAKRAVSYIEGDVFWTFLVKDGKGTGGHKNFRTVMMSMMSAAFPFAKAGFEVILDFSIPPWFLETALVMANKRDALLDYVVLTRTKKYVPNAQQTGRRAELKTMRNITACIYLSMTPKNISLKMMPILRQMWRHI